MQYAVRTVALTTLVALASACSKQPALTPEAQVTQGQGLYEAHCASCHEIDRGIGPRLTKQVLATRLSATALFTYTRKNMPYEAGNTLQEDEYWAITAYLLNRHGFLDGEVVLEPVTAEELMLTQP
jgi:mono/diheme cytochrome c family protein